MDTIRITDTIRIKEPIYITQRIIRTDTIYAERLDASGDSVKALIPITEREYRDKTYYAVVRGYNPTLHYIETYNTETTITNETTIRNEKIKRPRPKKWGIGVHAGTGYDFINNKRTNYVGIGVQFNVVQW